MRDFTGIPSSSLPPPSAPDFQNRLRNMLGDVDYFLRDLSRGIRRISDGEVPDGSGNPIPILPNSPTLLDYLYLPGRLGGQEVEGLDASPTVTIDQGVTGLTVDGSIGNPIFRIESANVGILDFRPYRFSAGNIEIALTDDAGTGVPINFPSDDGTSALRLTSTTNRTYIQAGLKNSAGNIINPNMTIGGTGAVVGSSLLYEFQRVAFANAGTVGALAASVTARSTRVGFNARPDDFASSSGANQPGSLFVRGIGGSITTDPAPIVVAGEALDSLFPMIEVRGPATGGAPSLVMGPRRWQLDDVGSMRWYSNSGTRTGRLSMIHSGTGDGGFQFINTDDRLQFETLPETGAFADSVTSLYLRIANTGTEVNRLMITSEGSAALSRLGIRATSTIIGPAAVGTMPAPVSSALLTLVDSAGAALFTMGSTGVSTFTKQLVVDNATASDVLFKLVPHASQSTDIFQVRNPSDTDTYVSVSSGGGLEVGSPTTPAVLTINTDTSGGPIDVIAFEDVSSGFTGTFALGALTNARQLVFPDLDGNLLTSNGIALTTFQLRSNTSSAGASFRDQTTNTKQLRFVLSGAVGNNSITLTNTAARNYGLGNLSGNVVIVGDDPPAVASGALGKVDLTAQTANIGTTNLSSTPPAGFYEVELYLMTTTADVTAGTLAVVIGWTDNVGATTDATIAAHPLTVTTTRSVLKIPIRVNSGDITYAVTNTGGYGTSQFAVYARVISLG